MSNKLFFISVICLAFVFNGCGGGGSDSSNSSNYQQHEESSDDLYSDDLYQEDTQNYLQLIHSYSIPTVYSWSYENVLLDGDNLILAGGENGRTAGATHDGSPLFSNKVIKWNMIDGSKSTLEMNATTGHTYDGGDKGTGGRGNPTTVIHKLDQDKYLISGGFQYVNSIEIADFTTNSVQKITSVADITDDTGLNTTSFYTDGQGSAEDNDGNIYWFGFNNGLYGQDKIMKFDKVTKELHILDTTLTMPRSRVFAHKLSDGKIILIGGWDGTASTEPDSATRRVEIFDPQDYSIERVADFPAPSTHYANGSITKLIDNSNKICALVADHTYQYNISNDSWENGCDLNTSEISSDDFNSPDGAEMQGHYLGELSNGNIVFINNGRYSSDFSDEINGYPVDINTTIDVYNLVE